MNKYLLLIIFTIPIFSQHTLNRSEKITIKRKINSVGLYSDLDFRTTDKRGLYYRHLEFGATIPLGKTWSTSLQYRSIYTNNGSIWKLEKRPKALIQKTLKSNKLKWAVRSLQEYRIRKGKDDALRNRVRVMAKSNTNWNGLTPFMGNEFFYDMEKNEYNKNWFVLGFDLSKKSNIAPTIYYKHISDYVDGKWMSTYTMVFKFTI
tara:strand:+ start:6515 stop:7129 length:615 start_codon:yes stop_codon:yes gene_type:complete